MAVVVGFHYNIISCELGVRRGAAEAESNARVCGGNVVGLTSILDPGQFF